MQIRKLIPAEHAQTRDLWEQVFDEDSKSFLDYYYFMKTKDNEIYVIEEDGNIQSMIQLNPYTLKTNEALFRGNYIIGVATAPDYRKRGYMGQLLRQTMQDMYTRKELFTFLMPAAEAIYTPYDFRYVYRQSQETLQQSTFKATDEPSYLNREASFFDCEQLASFFSEHIEANWQVCTIRDTAYYQSVLLERQSELGGIRMVFDGEKLIGTFTYMAEEGLEVLEPLFLSGYEDAFYAALSTLATEKQLDFPIKIYATQQACTSKKPLIMARILRLEDFLKTLTVRSGEQLHCSFAVLDSILPQNSKVLEINGDAADSNVPCHIQVRETEDSEGVLTIGALTSLLFGYKAVEAIASEENVILSEHLASELQKIQPLTQIYLNEIV